jgi:hypothetical protein
MICPYCGQDKEDGEMTDEHVLPDALGGNLEPTNPFKIRVCERCNRVCGKYVDGPFIRSWFIHNARAFGASRFIDLAAEPTLPLVIMGPLGDWKETDLTCDVWLGPTGDHVYHFHKPYDASPAIIGRPPHLRQREMDKGVVLTLLVGTNPVWHPTIFRSIRNAFADDTPIYYLNVGKDGIGPPYPSIQDQEHQRLADWVLALPADRNRTFTPPIDPDCGDRFLMKAGLGLGAKLFGDRYVESEDARILRTALWEPDRSKWDPRTLGTAFFQQADPRFVDGLNWEGCHAIVLVGLGQHLGLTVNFYGRHNASVAVSSDPTIWSTVVGREGLMWIVAPGLRTFAGPMTIGDYVGERHNLKLRGVEPQGPLKDLHARLAAIPPLPQYMAPGIPPASSQQSLSDPPAKIAP